LGWSFAGNGGSGLVIQSPKLLASFAAFYDLWLDQELPFRSTQSPNWAAKGQGASLVYDDDCEDLPVVVGDQALSRCRTTRG